MYSRNHAVVSALVGIPLVAVAPDSQDPVHIMVLVVVFGVGIDLDHFVIGRINRGDWTNLVDCIQSPSRAFVRQETIFEPGDVWRDQRLLSHLLIGGLLVPPVFFLDSYLSFIVAITIYVHVLADLYSDIRTRDDYLNRIV